MSLVGTRPPTVDEYEQYELGHRKRLAMKPGLTGMWQVSGRSDITDFDEVVALDDKTLDSYAQKLAQAKGLELLNISYNWHDIIRPGKLVWCPSVEEYLGLIRDAEYVIADSFHATAFSIQFHKKFISFYPEKASMRIRDILSKLDIPQRGTEGEVTIRDIEKDIDYETIDKKLNAYRVQVLYGRIC